MTFDEFLGAELTPLRRYAAVLTGDTHLAEDVLADALMKVYVRWRKISRMNNPAAYVHRVVTTTFISAKRRQARRAIVVAPGELPEVAAADATSAIDTIGQLAGPLAELPRQQQAAVVLRYFLGFDHAGIAAELGISTGAARTAVSRALARLRVTVVDCRTPPDSPGGGTHSRFAGRDALVPLYPSTKEGQA